MIELVTPSPSQDLTVLQTAKLELGVTGSANDARIASLILQASRACAAYCCRPEGFGRATWRQTERLAGSLAGPIILDRDLSPEITSVTVDGVALTSTEWMLDGALLYRLVDDRVAAWSCSKIVIVFAAGYTLLNGLPADIERACLLTVQVLYASAGGNPMIRSESAQDVGQVSYLDPRAEMGGLPPQAAGLLAPYRLYAV